MSPTPYGSRAEPVTQPQPKSLRRSRSRKLRIIPLGGLGEIGMNMMIFEYGEDMFVVDCGQTFPDEELLGIDLVIPDISYVLENRARFRGIIITHAHEDHIGGLPYLLDEVRAPVYGTALTIGLVQEKLKEFDLDTSVEFITVAPKDVVQIGAVEIEFIFEAK